MTLKHRALGSANIVARTSGANFGINVASLCTIARSFAVNSFFVVKMLGWNMKTGLTKFA